MIHKDVVVVVVVGPHRPSNIVIVVCVVCRWVVRVVGPVVPCPAVSCRVVSCRAVAYLAAGVLVPAFPARP